MDSTCRVIFKKWVVPLRSQILVWMQMILRHRLMLRARDLFFFKRTRILFFGSGKAASRSCLGCFASLLSSELTSSLEKESFCSSTYSDFWKDIKPMPYGPWIFFTKDCLCLLPCIWERKVQCFLSLSISPKVSVLVDSTVETVGGAASLWFGFGCLRSRLTLLGGLELSWKIKKLWLELRYGPLCSGICLPSCFWFDLFFLAIDHIHTLLERGGILLPPAALPSALAGEFASLFSIPDARN